MLLEQVVIVQRTLSSSDLRGNYNSDGRRNVVFGNVFLLRKDFRKDRGKHIMLHL